MRQVSVSAGEAVRFPPEDWQLGQSDGSDTVEAFSVGSPTQLAPGEARLDGPACETETAFRVESEPQDSGDHVAETRRCLRCGVLREVSSDPGLRAGTSMPVTRSASQESTDERRLGLLEVFTGRRRCTVEFACQFLDGHRPGNVVVAQFDGGVQNCALADAESSQDTVVGALAMVPGVLLGGTALWVSARG